jgi:hypothetical protein
MVAILFSARGAMAGALEDGVAAYDRADWATALRLLRPFAERGDANAQYLVGNLYGSGYGVDSDPDEAVRWWRKAADQGEARAQDELGTAYVWGLGVHKDYSQAAKWFHKERDETRANVLHVRFWHLRWRPDRLDRVEAENTPDHWDSGRVTRMFQSRLQLRHSVDKLTRLRTKEPPVASIVLAEEAVVQFRGFDKPANARRQRLPLVSVVHLLFALPRSKHHQRRCWSALRRRQPQDHVAVALAGTAHGPKTLDHVWRIWDVWGDVSNRRIALKNSAWSGRQSLILFFWEQEIRPMMGERRVMQEALFYGFSLERHVPDNHMLRKIDRFVDLSELRAHLGPYYSEVGRPSIDPELMMRMLIVGYCLGIRSERRLCEEVHLNLAYRWFL